LGFQKKSQPHQLPFFSREFGYVEIVIPEKSVLFLPKDRFYPVSDFEITDLPGR
jgi:hypothetical protein